MEENVVEKKESWFKKTFTKENIKNGVTLIGSVCGLLSMGLWGACIHSAMNESSQSVSINDNVEVVPTSTKEVVEA